MKINTAKYLYENLKYHIKLYYKIFGSLWTSYNLMQVMPQTLEMMSSIWKFEDQIRQIELKEYNKVKNKDSFSYLQYFRMPSVNSITKHFAHELQKELSCEDTNQKIQPLLDNFAEKLSNQLYSAEKNSVPALLLAGMEEHYIQILGEHENLLNDFKNLQNQAEIKNNENIELKQSFDKKIENNIKKIELLEKKVTELSTKNQQLTNLVVTLSR